MNRQLGNPLARSHWRSLALVLAAWLSLTASSALAGSASPYPPAVVSGGTVWTMRATIPLAASAWWSQIYPTVEKLLSSRAGMLQFGAIMALLALVVIWWRK
jgi:hypothetical protein